MSMLRYIELKSGFGDSGPAWIGRVILSRSKITVYFNGRAFKKARGGGVSGNYFDVESGEEFWISGVKKNGEDRHWAGSGYVLVEAAAVTEYLALRNIEALDRSRYEVTKSIIQTDIAKLKEIENRSSCPTYVEEDQTHNPTVEGTLCDKAAQRPSLPRYAAESGLWHA